MIVKFVGVLLVSALIVAALLTAFPGVFRVSPLY